MDNITIREDRLGIEGLPSPEALRNFPRTHKITINVEVAQGNSPEKIAVDIAEKSALQFHAALKKLFPAEDQIKILGGMIERWQKILEEFKVRKHR